MSFLSSFRSRASVAVAILGLVALLSCQNDVTAPQPSTKVVSGHWNTTALRMPDSAAWALHDTTGAFALTTFASDTSFTIQAILPRVMGSSDTLALSLFTLSLRTTQALCRADANGILSLLSSAAHESMAAHILQVLDSLQKKSPAVWGAKTDSVAVQVRSLQKLYATLILSQDAVLKGFPATHPFGIDTVAVIDQILILASAQKLTLHGLDSMVTSLASLDSAKVRNEVRKLGLAGKIDTTILFPLPPVVINTAPSFAGATDISKTLDSAAQVVPNWITAITPGPSTESSQRVRFEVVADSGASLFSTLPTVDSSGTLRYQAKSAGKGVFRVRAHDNGDSTGTNVNVSAWKSFAIQLFSQPVLIATGPTVTIVAPTLNQTVDYGTTFFLVRLKVSDSSGVDTVLIQGERADTAQGEYRHEIPLTLIGTPTSIRIHAVDKIGNRSDTTIFVTRSSPSDNTKPSLTLLSPSARTGQTISMDTAAVLVRWRVVDVFGVVANAVLINGNVAAKETDSAWSLRVALPPTGKPVAIPVVATNIRQNQVFDTVWIARQLDTVRPSATFLAGLQRSMVVDDSVTSLKVGWNITDNYKMGAVTINRVTVPPAGSGEYSTTLQNLPLGPTTVSLSAQDSVGNSLIDSLVVTRQLGASPVLAVSYAEGTYDSILHVSITSSVADATVRYTVDGTDPSATNGLTYALGGTILISQSRVLKVMATATDHSPTTILSRTYTLVPDAPVFSLPSGTTADSMFNVGLSSPSNGVTFYYTTDGSTPKTGVSASTTSGVLIDSIRTLKVIATKNGWSSSQVVSGTFRANIPIFVDVEPWGSRVIRADGSLWTTGLALTLLDGSLNSRAVFAKAKEGIRAVNSSLLLTTAGDVFSYGGSYGSTATSLNPIASGMAKIAASLDPTAQSAMLVDTKGGLWALGLNNVGQLCTGDTVNLVTPKLVQSGVSDVGLDCYNVKGGYQCGSLFVTTTGAAIGCGYEFGSAQPNPLLPTQIPGTGYVSVSAWGYAFDGGYAGRFSLMKSSGELSDFGGSGWNVVRTNVKKVVVAGYSLYSLESYGWLYVQTQSASPTTAPWTLVSNGISDLSSNGHTTLYIKIDGTLWASGQNGTSWGLGDNGGLYGDGTMVDDTGMRRIHLPN
jgi:hypothetical protein